MNFDFETANTKRLNSKVNRTNLQDRGYDVLFRFILRVSKAPWKPIKLARFPSLDKIKQFDILEEDSNLCRIRPSNSYEFYANIWDSKYVTLSVYKV